MCVSISVPLFYVRRLMVGWVRSERLDGKWGIADVADAFALAQFLSSPSLANAAKLPIAIDPARIAITGASAGVYVSPTSL